MQPAEWLPFSGCQNYGAQRPVCCCCCCCCCCCYCSCCCCRFVVVVGFDVVVVFENVVVVVVLLLLLLLLLLLMLLLLLLLFLLLLLLHGSPVVWGWKAARSKVEHWVEIRAKVLRDCRQHSQFILGLPTLTSDHLTNMVMEAMIKCPITLQSKLLQIFFYLMTSRKSCLQFRLTFYFNSTSLEDEHRHLQFK